MKRIMNFVWSNLWLIIVAIVALVGLTWFLTDRKDKLPAQVSDDIDELKALGVKRITVSKNMTDPKMIDVHIQVNDATPDQVKGFKMLGFAQDKDNESIFFKTYSNL